MQSVPCNRDANGNVTSYCEIATVNTTQPNEPPFDPKGRAYCDDLKVLGVCTLYGQRECVPANRKDVYAKDGTDLFCVGFQAPNQ